MKRIFTLMAVAAFTLSVFAQSPDLMSYQAVLRDTQDKLITNQAVAVQISIMQGTPNSVPVYSEVHSVSTNANGLISLEIGAGVSGDDFSLIDWSTGPFFLKTETDPAGGTNYTISSTTQLLSVPYAKYADEAGNAFSGNYADLTGAPTNVSTFTNDAGYLTTVTGSEPAFTNWDKDVTDDFSGSYGDLSGAPTNVSAFTNDAGYLTSQLWSQNGSNIYYNGGRVGIGTSSPPRFVTINSGGDYNYLTLLNNATGASANDGFMMGTDPSFDSYLWNWENGPIYFGTNNSFAMAISAAGNVGIGIYNPSVALDVRGDVRFGSNGIAFNEIREITGTTGATGHVTNIPLPTGYTEDNTRVLSCEINFGGSYWVGLGSHYRTATSPLHKVSYLLLSELFYIYYPDESDYHSRSFRAIIMRIAP